MRLVSLLLAVVAAAVLGARPAAAQDGTSLVRTALASDASAVAKGGSASLAITLSVAPGWHVYWRNPGDAGLAPSVDWRLPRGVSVGGFEWPLPERSVTSTVGSYVYNGDVTILAPLHVAAKTTASGTVPIRGTLSWLVCKNVCIPGHRDMATTIRIDSQTTRDPKEAALFRSARRAIPAPGPFAVTFAIAGDRVRIAVPSRAYEHLTVTDATFFPADQNLVAHAVPERVSPSADGIVLELARSQIADHPRTVDGDLLVETRAAGGPPQRFVYAVSAKPGLVPSPESALAAAPTDSFGILTALGLAFLGGLLLNVMPCVFPVLSLKAMALVREPAADRRHETLAFAAGVVGSALVLGTAILALRGTTAALGWGFQLQSPSFVAYLALVIFVLGLAMSGVAELTLVVPQFLTRVHRTGAIASAIADGALVTLIGSSCTVPFMGAALGYALTAPPVAALAVFAVLGLGLATPFALVSLVPAIARLIPKPGRWTETARHLLAFPLYATLAWLAWVFAREAPDALPAFLAALLAAAFAMWLLGASQRSATRGSAFARGLAVAVVAFAAVVVSPLFVRPQTVTAAAAAHGYERFTPERLAQLRASHRRAFVDLTAAWCVTCQVNERVALDRPDVRQRFADLRVVALRGDWTTQDPAITAYLQSFGHSGVPLYVYYDADGSVHVLPQLLTPSTVLDVVHPTSTAQT